MTDNWLKELFINEAKHVLPTNSQTEIDESKLEQIVADYLTANPPETGIVDETKLGKLVDDYLTDNPPNDAVKF